MSLYSAGYRCDHQSCQSLLIMHVEYSACHLRCCVSCVCQIGPPAMELDVRGISEPLGSQRGKLVNGSAQVLARSLQLQGASVIYSFLSSVISLETRRPRSFAPPASDAASICSPPAKRVALQQRTFYQDGCRPESSRGCAVDRLCAT